MKRLSLILVVLLAFTVAGSSSVFSQKSFLNDDPIPVPITENPDEEGEYDPRQGVPIQCYYNTGGAFLDLFYMENLGTNTVTVTNSTTGSSVSETLFPYTYNTRIYLSGDAGRYLIIITAASGSYSGTFLI